MFEVWCEWDIGQEGQIFTSEEKAKEWFNNFAPDLLKECFLPEDLEGNILDFDFVSKEGLVAIKELHIAA